MNREVAGFFEEIINEYDLNDGVEAYRFCIIDGHLGIQCSSLCTFVQLLTVAFEALSQRGIEEFNEGLPTAGGFEYEISKVDGEMFFYDPRFQGREAVEVEVVSALAVEAEVEALGLSLV